MQRKSIYHLRIAVLSSLLLASTLTTVSPAAALETVEKSVTMKATPRQIVAAIVKHRTADPQTRKIVSTKKDGAVVMQERLDSPLPIARDTIVYEEDIENDNRVDYRLVGAEKLTTFEGSWTMTESRPGYTHVRLTASVDSSLKIPFKGHILRNEASKGIDKRLSFVKEQSEKL